MSATPTKNELVDWLNEQGLTDLATRVEAGDEIAVRVALAQYGGEQARSGDTVAEDTQPVASDLRAAQRAARLAQAAAWEALEPALGILEQDYAPAPRHNEGVGGRQSLLPSWVDTIEVPAPGQDQDLTPEQMRHYQETGELPERDMITRAPRRSDYEAGFARPTDKTYMNTVWMGDVEEVEVPGTAPEGPVGRFLVGGDDSQGAVRPPGQTKKEKTPVLLQRALNLPYLWDEKKINSAMQRMRKAGFDVNHFDEMVDVWESMVDRAHKTWAISKGSKAITPWDVLDMARRENTKAGIVDENGVQVQKSVATSVEEVSDGDAWAMLTSVAAGALGREPTHEEVRRFAYRANRIAAENPTTVTTTSRTNPETGRTRTNSETEQGFSSNDLAHMAEDEFEDTPEAYQQASATYAGALISALDSVVE